MTVSREHFRLISDASRRTPKRLLACAARLGAFPHPRPFLPSAPASRGISHCDSSRTTALLCWALRCCCCLPRAQAERGDRLHAGQRPGPHELRAQKALDSLPTDSDEYSNCREVLAGAIHDGSTRAVVDRRTPGRTGAPLPDREGASASRTGQALAALTGSDRQPPRVDVGGQSVQPGDYGLYDLASASNDLPVPLLIALIALGLLALTGTLAAPRSRILRSGACRCVQDTRTRVSRAHAPRVAEVVSAPPSRASPSAPPAAASSSADDHRRGCCW